MQGYHRIPLIRSMNLRAATEGLLVRQMKGDGLSGIPIFGLTT